MAAISSLQIGGVTYDIYAKSAEQAPGSSHELSSHSHFSTYFNGTSANSALTSKSALSAGSAAKAASATSALTAGSADKVRLISLDNASNYQVILGATGTQNLYYDSDLNIQYNTSSNTFYSPNISATNISGNSISAGKLTGTQFILVSASATQANITAGNATDVNNLNNPKIGFWNSAANQKGYLIWTDVNASNLWSAAETAFYGTITDGLVLTSDQMNSIFVSKNLSATNFKATKISATNISGNLTGWATSANNAQKLLQTSIGFSRTTAQGGDGKKWCRIASKEITNFTTASVWGSCEAELNIYTKSYGDDHLVDRGKVILYCQWGHASASTPSYSMKTNGSRGARWLYWKPQQTSTSVSADSAVSAYAPFNGLKKVDIKIVATDTSVEWWLYNDVWDTTILYTNYFSDNLTLYGKNSAKTLGEFKTYLEDNRTQWDDVQGDGSYINYALSAKAAPVASHTISSHSDSANFFSGNSARSACSATSAKNAGTATSAGTAANVNASQWNADSARYILFGENKASTTVGYDSDFTYNPSSNKLLVKNISSTNITATTFSGNLSGNATSAKNAGTATYATSAGAAPLVAHDHSYTISAKTTAFNVSAGIQLSAGSNINITSAGTKSIGISARNDIANASDKSTYFDGTSALYAKSATSATNAAKAADSDKLGGTAAANVIGSAQSGYKALTALSALSGIKNYSTIVFNSGTTLRGTFTPADSASTFTLVAGSNVDFTASGANTITISAKDTTYTTSNFITATHLSNIQTASGYAADWNTNKTGLTNSAKSGWSAWSAVTANSSTWATNTDTKVSQTVTSDNVFYPILTKDSNGTTTVTAGARFADVVTINPSSKMVRANKFGITSSATMEYNTATNSIDFIFN